jgi:hypothetical protein
MSPRRLVLLVALLTTVGLPGLVRNAHAQSGSDCTELGVVTLPAPGVVPVVVTYMRNTRRPDDDVESKRVSRDRITRGFQPSGEFQKVWTPLGIRFALLGVRTCTYTLIPGSEEPNVSAPREDFPDPNANFEDVFMRYIKNLNVREVQTSSGKVRLRGLDVYLWWSLEGMDSGFGVRPRFGRANEESGDQPDERVHGRPGAVWLDTGKCVRNATMTPKDFCANLFAHEAGHFFGLCHCCVRSTREHAQECRNFLRPGYCPGLPIPATGSDVPCEGQLDKRLMSATNPFTMEANLVVKACERNTARAGKEKVLKHGANWMDGD